MISTTGKLGIGGHFLKAVQLPTNPTAHILLNGERLAATSLRTGTRQTCPLSPLLFSTYWKSLWVSTCSVWDACLFSWILFTHPSGFNLNYPCWDRHSLTAHLSNPHSPPQSFCTTSEVQWLRAQSGLRLPGLRSKSITLRLYYTQSFLILLSLCFLIWKMEIIISGIIDLIQLGFWMGYYMSRIEDSAWYKEILMLVMIAVHCCYDRKEGLIHLNCLFFILSSIIILS